MEAMAEGVETKYMWINKRSLFLGIVLASPFFIANVLVVIRAEFFLSILRPLGQTTSYEQILVLALIALVGVGGLVTLLPILRKRRLYVVNAIVGLAFLVFALFGGYELGKDFYHCDILKIPNCD